MPNFTQIRKNHRKSIIEASMMKFITDRGGFFENHQITKKVVNNALPIAYTAAESALLGFLTVWAAQKGVNYLRSFPAVDIFFTKYTPEAVTNVVNHPHYLYYTAGILATLLLASAAYRVFKNSREYDNLNDESKDLFTADKTLAWSPVIAALTFVSATVALVTQKLQKGEGSRCGGTADVPSSTVNDAKDESSQLSPVLR